MNLIANTQFGNSQRNFCHDTKKVSNMNISKCNVEHPQCFTFVLRGARYLYLCFLRAFVHVLRLIVLIFAGKQVPEDVVGRE